MNLLSKLVSKANLIVIVFAILGVAAVINVGLVRLSSTGVNVGGDHNTVTVVVPNDPVDLQPHDIACNAQVVRREDAPNVGGRTYTALLTNDTGTRTYFVRWTDADELKGKLVVEYTFPGPDGATKILTAYPDTDKATTDCLKARWK